MTVNGGYFGDVSQTTNAITSQSANYNIQNTNSVIFMNGNLTATLPTAVGIPGKQFTIITKTSGTNAIVPQAGQTISGSGFLGAAKCTNTVNGSSTTLISDNANWWIVSHN